MRRTVLTCSILILCCLVNYFHGQATAALRKQESDAGVIFVPDALTVKLAALGFDELIFDWYWLEFIQYLGDRKSRQSDQSAKAERYLDLLSTLDPHFTPTYYFAAIILGGDQNHAANAEKIIDRGIAANPESWLLPYAAGMNQYLFAHNEKRAARYYQMAAKLPEAPDWIGRQAKILEANIPSIIKEINVWDSMYRSSTDASVKQRALEKLVTLWVKVYKTAPTATIKNRARNQLRELGVSI
ncbi:MAG TPA: hypothetical protein V6C89_09935 [Drouetiella sp.]